jgi:hypothetical protein
MTRMNWGRILAGGLLTGILVAVSGSVVTAFTQEAWESAMTALGSEFADPSQTWPVASIAAGAAIQLGMGIVAVWLYAAFLPRFGPGLMTAAIVGCTVWLIGAVQTLSLVVLRALTFAHFLALTGPYIVVWILATMAGAKVYRE